MWVRGCATRRGPSPRPSSRLLGGPQPHVIGAVRVAGHRPNGDTAGRAAPIPAVAEQDRTLAASPRLHALSIAPCRRRARSLSGELSVVRTTCPAYLHQEEGRAASQWGMWQPTDLDLRPNVAPGVLKLLNTMLPSVSLEYCWIMFRACSERLFKSRRGGEYRATFGFERPLPVSDHLSGNSGELSAKSGRFRGTRPDLGRSRPNVLDSGRVWSNSGKHVAKLGRARTKGAGFRPDLARARPNLIEIDKMWSNSVRIWSSWVQSWSNSEKCWPNSIKICQQHSCCLHLRIRRAADRTKCRA